MASRSQEVDKTPLKEWTSSFEDRMSLFAKLEESNRAIRKVCSGKATSVHDNAIFIPALEIMFILQLDVMFLYVCSLKTTKPRYRVSVMVKLDLTCVWSLGISYKGL